MGRDDRSRQRYEGMGRPQLADVMTGLDRSLPVILLDHQPSDLGDAVREGIDLQLSGHSHRGQMFPNNFINSRIFEVDWGYLSRDGLQVLVFSGFGTWGPPIRVGNRPEILDIIIHFGKEN